MSRARRVVLVLLALLVLSIAALWTLAHSNRFAAWTVMRLLPQGMSVGAVHGSFAEGLTVDQFAMPGVEIERLAVAVDVHATVLGTPTLAGVDAAGIRIDPAAFPPADAEASEPSGLPENLPVFAVGPLTVADVRIDGESPVVIDRVGWQALVSRGASLHVEGLLVEGPVLKVSADGSFGLSTASDLRAELRYGDYAASLVLDGEPVTGSVVTLELSAPFAATLSGRLRGLPSAPAGEFQLRLPALSPEQSTMPAVQPLAPLAADLTLSGDRNGLQIGGVLTVRGQPLQLDGSLLQWAGDHLQLSPLAIGVGAGTLDIRGEWPLVADAAPGSLRLAGQRLAWPGVPVVLATLAAELRGDASRLALTLDADLEREQTRVPLRLEAALADDLASVTTFALGIGDGTATGTATYALADGAIEAALQLDGLDLSTLLPEQPTRLDGALTLSGAAATGWRLGVDGIRGQWRALPLSLDGELNWTGRGLPAGRFVAMLDGNRLDLRPTATGHQASLTLGSLGAILPGAEAAGQIELTQAGELLTWSLDIDALRLPAEGGARELRGLTGQGQVDLTAAWVADGRVALTEFQQGDTRYGPLTLDASGSAARHRVSGRVVLPQGELSVTANGGLAAQGPTGWAGQLERLELAPNGLPEPPLSLSAPQALRFSAGVLTLERGCLRRESASLCLEAALATTGDAPGALTLALTELDLGLLPRPDGGDWQLAGQLDGEARITFAGLALQTLALQLSTPALTFSVDRDELQKTVTVRELGLSVDGPMTAIRGRLSAELEGAGPLLLTVEGLGGEAPSGSLDVDFASLALLDGLSPELVQPEGRLAGQLSLSGSPAALDIGGVLTLSGLKAELPGAGLRLQGGELALRFPAPGVAALAGRLSTGEGELIIDARAERDADGQPQLEATIGGERVLVADLPNVRLLASPNLRMATQGGVLRVTGNLGLPEGRIDLARFEPAVSASPDVVVLDRPTSTPAPVQTDIRYTLGPALKLKGFGLDTSLNGGLRVRSRPGRPVTASGTLDLVGSYRAYGQNLTIDRGRLLWANAPIGNPGFDFSAYRSIDQLKAGVRVRGSAAAPELTVYTDPPREASDALSWLVLGRPLSSASGSDGQRLSAAAGALGSVGGALIGATIGQRLGVEINVESSAELGGSPAFTVGKMLSPKLFVGFGRSLFDSAQLVIVRYRLTDRYELEALSGRETKIGANYRFER